MNTQSQPAQLAEGASSPYQAVVSAEPAREDISTWARDCDDRYAAVGVCQQLSGLSDTEATSLPPFFD